MRRRIQKPSQVHVPFLDHLSNRGVHELKIANTFHGRVTYDGPPVFPYPLVLLAFSNRSGSNLLAGYLRNTRRFAGCGEHLNHDGVERIAPEFGAETFPDFIRAFEAARRGDAAILGFKASSHQIAMLLRWRIDTMYQGVRIIHIVREDALAQGISFSIAAQTRQWSSAQKNEGIVPDYDFDDISARVDGALVSGNAIALLASVFELPYLRVSYDDLVRDPATAVRSVAAFCDVDVGAWKPGRAPIEKQATELNDAFGVRYRAEARSRILG